jgi:hypothetical protein
MHLGVARLFVIVIKTFVESNPVPLFSCSVKKLRISRLALSAG